MSVRNLPKSFELFSAGGLILLESADSLDATEDLIERVAGDVGTESPRLCRGDQATGNFFTHQF